MENDRTTPEQLIAAQLAACLAGMQDCLAHSRAPNGEDDYGNLRRADIGYVAKLMKASARLTEALGKLKGETRHAIHVVRSVETPLLDRPLLDKGEG